MPLILYYVLAAGAGVLIALFFSRAPELRSLRLSQVVLVPIGFVVGFYFFQDGGMQTFVCFVAVMFYLALLLGPNIAFYCGAALTSFLDPHDWTPAEEEIALSPIRRLIDNDKYNQALGELEKILQTCRPTYEAVLLQAKLLHHCGRVPETVATLLSLIELSQTAGQQLAVMELLALLEEYHEDPPTTGPPSAGRIQIQHELILFPLADGVAASHKEIPPGAYEVEPIRHRHHRWLKIKGEEWGNAEMCWEAVRAVERPAAAPPQRGFFWKIARMHQTISTALKGKPHLQRQAEAQKLFHEANQCIRRQDWPGARPLLQKASACDPGRYEIAYRWVQAVRQTADDAATEQALQQVLGQNQWSGNEVEMLQQLKH